MFLYYSLWTSLSVFFFNMRLIITNIIVFGIVGLFNLTIIWQFHVGSLVQACASKLLDSRDSVDAKMQSFLVSDTWVIEKKFHYDDIQLLCGYT